MYHPVTHTRVDACVRDWVIHEYESASFTQTFPMYTAVEIKIDGQWQTGMSGYIQEHPTDDEPHRVGEALVYIDRYSDGTKGDSAR